ALVESCKICGEIPFNGTTQVVVPMRFLTTYRERRLRQFGLDHRNGDGFLRIECSQPAGQILKFANIAGPAIPLKAIERQLVDLLRRQTLALGLREEMANEIRNIFSALAQRRQS